MGTQKGDDINYSFDLTDNGIAVYDNRDPGVPIFDTERSAAIDALLKAIFNELGEGLQQSAKRFRAYKGETAG
jgi:hypothetical protein